VNLVQIHSAVPEIFEAQTKKTKKSHTVLKTKPYLCAVKIHFKENITNSTGDSVERQRRTLLSQFEANLPTSHLAIYRPKYTLYMQMMLNQTS